jgi:hypothetical protein
MVIRGAGNPNACRRDGMKRWALAAVLLFVATFQGDPVFAQSPPAPLAGEWRVGGPRAWVVVVEQDGLKVRGSWKDSYRDKQLTCSGVWFEGMISGDRIAGSYHPCGGKTITEPLDLKIINEKTLEMTTLAPGGPARTTSLRRIK